MKTLEQAVRAEAIAAEPQQQQVPLVPSIRARRKRMARRHQGQGRGYLYTASGKWYVRYHEGVVQPDGSIKNCQVSSPFLATTAEIRTKAEARRLADEYLNDLHTTAPTALGTTEISVFVEAVYLPWVKLQREPSTYNGYRKQWHGYFRNRLRGIRLRDFKPADGERLLQQIASEERTREGELLSHETLRRLKSFLSGIFTHAIRQGYLNGVNPIAPVSIPKGADVETVEETYAYSLKEELAMLGALRGQLQLAVAIASFTGLSLSEMRGLQWEDYDGETIQVRRKMWGWGRQGIVGKPKTKKRRGRVPVIGQLKRYLDQWRKPAGWILANEVGEPYSIEWETRATLKPLLMASGISFHGWHAFRRGLATNLYQLGVSDKVIQILLRHGSVQVTQASYIKEVRSDVVAAMQELERTLGSQAAAAALEKERVN
jgi:integrase